MPWLDHFAMSRISLHFLRFVSRQVSWSDHVAMSFQISCHSSPTVLDALTGSIWHFQLHFYSKVNIAHSERLCTSTHESPCLDHFATTPRFCCATCFWWLAFQCFHASHLSPHVSARCSRDCGRIILTYRFGCFPVFCARFLLNLYEFVTSMRETR